MNEMNINSSGVYAKERLKGILVADRIGCSPDLITNIETDISQCVSKYINIEKNGIDIQLSDSLILARIPVTGIERQKKKPEEEEQDHTYGREEVQTY